MTSLRFLLGLVFAGAGLTIFTANATASCAPLRDFVAHGRLEAGDVVVAFRTVPAPIEVGRHFSVEAIVCANPPARGLRVDAQMPEHRHGMNYRARVLAAGDGRYVAEGLLFHMPGRWQLLFDVERDGRTERLATDVVLE
ncbi:MAG: hypothetical protein ACREK6_01595 [Candidatus Rokuibacteriota bacterium]